MLKPLSLACCIPVALIILTADLHAGPVQRHIERVMPRSGQRGTTVEVTIQGVELNDVREAIFYRGGIEAVEFSSAVTIPPRGLHHGARIEQQVTCRFWIAANCPIGVHPFRLRTAHELTTVSTFRVTPFPVVKESEQARGQNDLIATAETLSVESATVAGQIQGDVDCFRISRRKGDHISVEVDSVWLTEIAYGEAENDLTVQILDDTGKLLARNDDSILHVQDPIVSTIAPRDGHYIVRIQQSVPLDVQVQYLAHIGTNIRPLVAFPPGGPAGQPLTLRLLGDPSGDLDANVTLPDREPTAELEALRNKVETQSVKPTTTVGFDFDYFPGPAEAQPPSALPLRVSPFANVLESEAGASTISLPVAINGIIKKPFEEDTYRLTAKKGDRYKVEVFGRSIGSPLDPRVWIRRADSSSPEIEGDDTPIAVSRFYSASGSIQRKELLDPTFVWEPKDDGEYLLTIADMRGLGDEMSVYRIEITPITDSINTDLFARVIDSMQCPRLTAPTVPVGNRWTMTFNLKEGLGNRYRGGLELFATGLPDGVQMIAPPVLPGQTTAAVQFVAANDAIPQARLIDVKVRPTDPSARANFQSCSQESFPFLSHSGGRAWHHVSVGQYVLAVTAPAPFTIDVTPPRIPLIRNGSLDVAVHVTRHGDFSGPIDVQAEWLPGGVSGAPAVTIAPDKTDAVYTLTASGGAPIATSQLALIATTTGGIDSGYYTGVGRIRVSTSFFKIDVTDPHIDLKSQPVAVRRGQRGRVVWRVEHRRPFEGSASAELLGLPKGVRVIGTPAQLLPGQAELAFEIEVPADTLLGPYRELSCEVSLVEKGQEIKQRLGRGILRIDP